MREIVEKNFFTFFSREFQIKHEKEFLFYILYVRRSSFSHTQQPHRPNQPARPPSDAALQSSLLPSLARSQHFFIFFFFYTMFFSLSIFSIVWKLELNGKLERHKVWGWREKAFAACCCLSIELEGTTLPPPQISPSPLHINIFEGFFISTKTLFLRGRCRATQKKPLNDALSLNFLYFLYEDDIKFVFMLMKKLKTQKKGREKEKKINFPHFIFD